MARLLLLRHGQSTWNAQQRWQGWADPPLSPEGETQSRQAAAWLADEGFTGVVTSDLQRARRTAAILAQELGLPEPTVDDRWRERNVGEWSGHSHDEILVRWPGQLEAWRAGQLERPPGGESQVDLAGRIMAAVHDWSAADGVLLVVTHGGVIHTAGVGLGAVWRGISNLSGAWVERGPGGPEPGERVGSTTPSATTTVL
ncbi:MAG TPA: histidine phosphatase family protein [Acidimicrobiales bacterium]|nr:histidine phosphatase family protein [Acidimicrobiales bacterium]